MFKVKYFALLSVIVCYGLFILTISRPHIEFHYKTAIVQIFDFLFSFVVSYQVYASLHSVIFRRKSSVLKIVWPVIYKEWEVHTHFKKECLVMLNWVTWAISLNNSFCLFICLCKSTWLYDFFFRYAFFGVFQNVFWELIYFWTLL